MICPLSGLYAITQTEQKTIATVLAEVAAVIRGGAVLVQYRDKNPIDAVYLASELVKLCHANDVPLLINDNVELALQVGAAGVHLGKDDGDISLARQSLGAHAIIGVSCYNSIDRALAAQQQGADYVAFGRFFPSNSKPLAAPAAIETLQQAKQQITLPIVAIGGVTPENGTQLLTAGADMLAVIGGLFDDQQPEMAANNYSALFTSQQ
jgi:thiamine-phosphate pyrophosphorylase